MQIVEYVLLVVMGAAYIYDSQLMAFTILHA